MALVRPHHETRPSSPQGQRMTDPDSSHQMTRVGPMFLELGTRKAIFVVRAPLWVKRVQPAHRVAKSPHLPSMAPGGRWAVASSGWGVGANRRDAGGLNSGLQHELRPCV